MNDEKVDAGTPAEPAASVPAKDMKAHRNMATLLVVGLIALGVMLWRVDLELSGLSNTLSMISENVRSSAPHKPEADQPKEVTVAQMSIKTKSGLVTVTQTCMGKTDAADTGKLPFCVGENKLVASNGSGKPTEISAGDFAVAKDAPVLMKLEYVAGSDNVLVSYGPNQCETVNDCGAGMPYHLVSHALDAASMTARAIKNYPKSGNVIWNAEGTKAVVVPDGCGGAGCTPQELWGFDFAEDTLKNVTTEKAVGGRGAAAGTLSAEATEKFPDAEGTDLPAWVNVKWTDNASFTAQVRPANYKPNAPLVDVAGTIE